MIVVLLQKSCPLIDDATERVKHEIKKQEGTFPDGTYCCFIDSTYGVFIDKTCASSLINDITGKGLEDEHYL